MTFENHSLQERLTFGDPFQDSGLVLSITHEARNLLSITHEARHLLSIIDNPRNLLCQLLLFFFYSYYRA